MNRETVKAQLQTLHMKTAARELDDTLESCKGRLSFDWLSQLLAREVDARKERALQWRIKRAQFPRVSTLEQFDWEFNPDINREKVMELATLDFVEQQKIALFLGKPGTGKTHLALAIALRAAEQGKKVFCTSLKKLSGQIIEAKHRGSLDRLFRRILSANLWLLDDWGVVSMSQEVAEEVFDLLDRRIGQNALLVTSNRDVDEWPTLFHEPVIASAAIDRLFDESTIVTFVGDSYRLAGKVEGHEETMKLHNY